MKIEGAVTAMISEYPFNHFDLVSLSFLQDPDTLQTLPVVCHYYPHRTPGLLSSPPHRAPPCLIRPIMVRFPRMVRYPTNVPSTGPHHGLLPRPTALPAPATHHHIRPLQPRLPCQVHFSTWERPLREVLTPHPRLARLTINQ